MRVGETAVFESAVILEYLEETQAKPLHPADPLRRAEHRAWIEFGSSVLSDIWGLYAAPDRQAFVAKAETRAGRFGRLEARLWRFLEARRSHPAGLMAKTAWSRRYSSGSVVNSNG